MSADVWSIGFGAGTSSGGVLVSADVSSSLLTIGAAAGAGAAPSPTTTLAAGEGVDGFRAGSGLLTGAGGELETNNERSHCQSDRRGGGAGAPEKPSSSVCANSAMLAYRSAANLAISLTHTC